MFFFMMRSWLTKWRRDAIFVTLRKMKVTNIHLEVEERLKNRAWKLQQVFNSLNWRSTEHTRESGTVLN